MSHLAAVLGSATSIWFVIFILSQFLFSVLAGAVHRVCVIVYYPLMFVDNLIGACRPPTHAPMRSLGPVSNVPLNARPVD